MCEIKPKYNKTKSKFMRHTSVVKVKSSKIFDFKSFEFLSLKKIIGAEIKATQKVKM